MHATNSEKVLVTTSTKESAVLETHLPHNKTGDDVNERL